MNSENIYKINSVLGLVGSSVWIIMSIGFMTPDFGLIVGYSLLSTLITLTYIKSYNDSYGESSKIFSFLKMVSIALSTLQLILLVSGNMVFWKVYVISFIIVLILFKIYNETEFNKIMSNKEWK